ncbi:hypothetical protein [Sphingobium sp. DC-2]|nr:hypothetical protein [Sphingobium sp. DC-2]
MFRKNVCVAGEHGETGFVSNFAKFQSRLLLPTVSDHDTGLVMAHPRGV